MIPERIRKAPMYWLTRSVMTSHPAITTMMVMNAVSSTNHTEMPSTPRWYITLKRSIQARFSTNCMFAVPTSKPVISGSVTKKEAMAAIKANQRTAATCSARPIANNTAPDKIGSQMARLNKPMFFFSP